MIKISRQERQVLRNLQNAITAEELRAKKAEEAKDQEFQSKSFQDILAEVNPGLETVQALVDKGVIILDEEDITKEPLQVEDEDPEVEAAWEKVRQLGNTKSFFDTNVKPADVAKANDELEQVLFEKGRLTHLVHRDGSHMWVTEDRVQYWLDRGWKEGSAKAVPTSCQ